MAYWYSPDRNELFLDLDDYERRVRRFGIWGEMFRQRLRDALNAGLLEVNLTDGEADIFLEESNTPNHFHVFIRLTHRLPLDQQMVWQMRLASDWKRSHSDLMRAARHIAPASLLIRSAPVEGFWREPDYVCPCESGKHETREQVRLIKAGRGCPTWQKLRGATPYELFGTPAHNGVEMPVPLPLGRVPLAKILEIGELKGDNDDAGF